MKLLGVVALFTCSLSLNLFSQTISEVLEYKPAPGQLINIAASGTPEAAQSIVNSTSGLVSLGGFGGYIVFKFAEPVKNHPNNPYGVDFTILGNALPDWSEPGIVLVMNDENKNGLPDDKWYELAGSDYYFSSTIPDYSVTYFNPKSENAADVFWKDNFGKSGAIWANEFHEQPYFPDSVLFPGINSDSLVFNGSRIFPSVDSVSGVQVKSYRRGFGYADNNLRGSAPFTVPDNPYTPEKENAGGDAFDISWAVDSLGNYIDLEEIDFIKVYNATNQQASYLGELSTEITGAIIVEANSLITGETESVVIKDLPVEIEPGKIQLEAYAFDTGRLNRITKINWSTNQEWAVIDENDKLVVNGSGALIITAELESNPEIKTSIQTFVNTATSTKLQELYSADIKVFPNPVFNWLKVENIKDATISIQNLNGQELIFKTRCGDFEEFDVQNFPDGIYILKVVLFNQISTYKILKH